MSIYRKKSAVINSQVRISNEISQVFVPNNNNIGISINTIVPVNSTGTIATTITNINENTAYSIGRNWTTIAASGVLWMSVCWSPKLRMFCSVSGKFNLPNGGRSMRSLDGINVYYANVGNGSWMAICWSEELSLFCTVSSLYPDNPVTSWVATSTDGVNWKNIGVATKQQISWSHICWSRELGLLCAVASSGNGSGNDQVMISRNASVWTSDSSGVLAVSWQSVCWAAELGLFCSVADSGGSANQRAMTSSDGINWNNGCTVLDSANEVCWSPELGLFCAVGNSGRVYLSRNGYNWDGPTSGVVSNYHWITVCWAPELGLFCAGANNGGVNRIMVSRDGYNWVSAIRIANDPGNGFGAVCWSYELCTFFFSMGGSCALVTDPAYRVPITPIQTNKYYIPLMSSTQEIKTNTSISYNINNNTLNLENLSTTNLPKCSAVPKTSTDLINKSYLNKYVGDYTQGWIYDDWITGGINGSLNWVINNSPADATALLPSDASGHIGIIKLIRTLINFTSLQSNSAIRFNSTQNISVRFLVRPFSNNSVEYTQIRLSLSAYLGNVNYYTTPANYENMASWVFDTSGVDVGTVSSNTKWQCLVNANIADASYNYGTSENSLRNKWVLFEIELNNQKPSFYITVVGETNRTLVYQETTKIIDSSVLLVPHIIIAAGTVSSTTSLDVDYIDIKYTGLTRG